MREGVAFGELIFITVGTPEDAEGNADLRYVFETAAAIGDWIDGYRLVVDKSTVPVGTSREVGRIIRERMAARGVSHPFDVASNPEFLREGKSVSDFLNPDRIVLGVGSARAEQLLRELYQVFVHSNKPMIVTTPETAEMIKYVTNSFLATKIAFINEVANLCEQVGANVLEVARTLGLDGRISPKYLHPGPGYGGSCFPKDTKAIVRDGAAVRGAAVDRGERHCRQRAAKGALRPARSSGTCRRAACWRCWGCRSSRRRTTCGNPPPWTSCAIWPVPAGSASGCMTRRPWTTRAWRWKTCRA